MYLLWSPATTLGILLYYVRILSLGPSPDTEGRNIKRGNKEQKVVKLISCGRYILKVLKAVNMIVNNSISSHFSLLSQGSNSNSFKVSIIDTDLHTTLFFSGILELFFPKIQHSLHIWQDRT